MLLNLPSFVDVVDVDVEEFLKREYEAFLKEQLLNTGEGEIKKIDEPKHNVDSYFNIVLE